MSDEKEFDKQEFFTLFLNPEVPFNLKFGFVSIAGLYLMSPIDLIPEALTGVFGFADDVGLVLIAAQIFTKLANNALEKIHNAEQEQAAQQQPIQGGVYSAHAAAPAQPADPNTPGVIQRHKQAQSQRQAPAPLPPPVQTGDFLHDEAHEQYISQKRHQVDDDFERLVKQREDEQKSSGWDYSRNDPFSKRNKEE